MAIERRRPETDKLCITYSPPYQSQPLADYLEIRVEDGQVHISIPKSGKITLSEDKWNAAMSIIEGWFQKDRRSRHEALRRANRFHRPTRDR